MKKLIACCLFLLVAGPCFAEMISVVHQPAELKDQPHAARVKVLSQLPLYAPLKVLEAGREYLKVQDYSGRTGYVHKAVTGEVASLAVKAEVCNVRSGPGIEYPIAFKTTRGSSFKALTRTGEWIEIVNVQGQLGWIWQKLTWGY